MMDKSFGEAQFAVSQIFDKYIAGFEAALNRMPVDGKQLGENTLLTVQFMREMVLGELEEKRVLGEG